jgi:putative transcriptional regulator
MATKTKKQKVTSSNFGSMLLASVEEGLQHTRGGLDLRETVARIAATPPNYSSTAIKNIRHKYHLTQDLLAQLLGVKSAAVKHWEQGLRKPSASVRRLLQIIEVNPEIVQEIA